MRITCYTREIVEHISNQPSASFPKNEKSFLNKVMFIYIGIQGDYKVFIQFECEFVAHWFMWSKTAGNCKFQLVSYAHFLKISFKINKCGLSYSLKRDSRPFSKFTKVRTILSLTASKNAFWRLPLIDWTFQFHWGQFQPPINQDSISRQSIIASKMHFWKLSMVKWCALL